MNAEFRTFQSRPGLVVLVLAATVVGILASALTLGSAASGWSDGAIFALLLALVGGGFGGMVLLLLHLRREVIYTVTPRGLREEVRRRGAEAREREIAWGEVRSYRAAVQGYGGFEYLRLTTPEGKITLYSGKDESTATAFAAFRDAALPHLRAAGVPESRPSRAFVVASRAFGWILIVLVLAVPVYALSLPGEQRPDLWWLRWLVVVGLASPFIRGALHAGRARE